MVLQTGRGVHVEGWNERSPTQEGGGERGWRGLRPATEGRPVYGAPSSALVSAGQPALRSGW